ncbi:hypothetical protein Tco_0788734 [Tanacetum coccineum]
MTLCITTQVITGTTGLVTITTYVHDHEVELLIARCDWEYIVWGIANCYDRSIGIDDPRRVTSYHWERTLTMSNQGCSSGGGQYKATALGFYQRNNANPSYQEQRQSMEESLSKFMNELAKRHKVNSNMIKEIRASTDAAIRNQGASIKTLKIQIGKISKVLQERGFGSLPSSTKTNLRDHVKSISTTVETDTTPLRRIGSS